ncbi:hypothetical protein OG320_09225 [Microbispora sp. NBC_01189]|uniref:hypothetical protein n=1 Tax=Microbispora sp. NBC_01189 TaxID=2903583 RepID=UPI002E14D62A|nr:hypothetical protein OG320_09225 [Microbispora sp. NBC_01189]
MTKRRSRGDGGLHWDEGRQRWIASVTVGYTPQGKRIAKKANGKTKTEVKTKLKAIIRDYQDRSPRHLDRLHRGGRRTELVGVRAERTRPRHP